MNKISYKNLSSFVNQVLERVGLDRFSNESVCAGLCETSLRGVDSHGVRLLPHYVNSAIAGRKNPKPNMKYHTAYPAAGMLHADDAFGHAAGFKAIDIGMDLADQFGVSAISVSHSSHPGAMASFVLRAARKGYVAFAFTHADALILSHGGTRPYFGTNPMAMAAPRKDMEPYCLDMAPSFFSWNKVKSYKEQGLDLPAGIAVDKNAETITDPEAASCLSGIGNYKGYALASMVEVLCGVISGMTFGRSIPSMFGTSIEQARKLAQFYLVLKPDLAISHEFFVESMKRMTEEIASEPRKGADSVILPGEKEDRCARYRKECGIPLDEYTYTALTELASQYNIDFLVSTAEGVK